MKNEESRTKPRAKRRRRNRERTRFLCFRVMVEKILIIIPLLAGDCGGHRGGRGSGRLLHDLVPRRTPHPDNRYSSMHRCQIRFALFIRGRKSDLYFPVVCLFVLFPQIEFVVMSCLLQRIDYKTYRLRTSLTGL